MNVGQGQNFIDSSVVLATTPNTFFTPGNGPFFSVPTGGILTRTGGFQNQDVKVGYFRQAQQFSRATTIVSVVGFFGPTYLISGLDSSVIGVDSTTAAWTIGLPDARNTGTDQGSAITFTVKDVGLFASTNPILIQPYLITSNSTGSTDGSSTFTDLSTVWSGSVFPGDWLRILSGPSAGDYKILTVPDATSLTVTPPLPADTGISYLIYEGGIEGQLDYTINSYGGAATFHYIEGYGWRVIL